jgi:hypothetical protein
MAEPKVEKKKKEKADKIKVEKIEDEDESLRRYKAITEMVRKLIEAVDKEEKIDFMTVVCSQSRLERTALQSSDFLHFQKQ